MEEARNFVEVLFKRSINHMKTTDWEWPERWDDYTQTKIFRRKP